MVMTAPAMFIHTHCWQQTLQIDHALEAHSMQVSNADPPYLVSVVQLICNSYEVSIGS